MTVVLAAKGYPESYVKGMRIDGLDRINNELVFHAGTKLSNDEIVTSGGRVLDAVGFGKDLNSAIEDAYDIVKAVDFSGKYYRKDIGKRGLQYLKKGVKND